jgi:hypothetical protein
MDLMNTYDKFKINSLLSVLLFLRFSSFVSAQEDLFSSIREESKEIKTELLPKRMVFTQRLLWGENGLMRKTQWSPLTIEQREKELKVRRKMLKAHQIIGFVTLAGMVAQGVMGTQLYKGDYRYYETHETIGNLTSISYFTGAGLSLFAPPPLINKKTKGLSSAQAHKYLATIHFSAMLATNILAEENKQLHRAAAFTAFGSYVAAILVFKF